MKTLRNAFLMCAFAILASCRTPPTEIVLRVETDIDQGPGHTLTDVRVRVAPAGTPTAAVLDMTYPLGVRGMPLLPADLGITPRDNDARRSVLVEVTAISNGTELFTYRAIAPFEAARTNLLSVFLANRCTVQANRDMCSPSQTCGREGCESVERMNLPQFIADAAVDSSSDLGIDTRTDAVTDMGIDATMDVTADVACGAGFLTCNGLCIPADDVHNCGACGHDCAGLANIVTSTATCTAGVCGFTCATDFGDCDSTRDNGCEADLHVSPNCGACGTTCATGMVCSSTGTSYGCSSSCRAPTPTMCGSSCVDTNTNAANCGACGNICQAPSSNGSAACVGGSCTIACLGGYHACSSQCVANVAVTSCGASCSACPIPANAVATCNGITCGFTCIPGFDDCDGNPANGCEQQLDVSAHCGSCANACSGGTPNCQQIAAGSYACVSGCTAGGACDPPNPCRYGTVTCSSGMSVCMPTGSYPVGSACRGGGGVCDASSNCNACTAGIGCSTGNPCQYGSTDCSTGAQRCVVIGNVGVGNACPGGVCNGSGACVPCQSGMTCSTGNPCTYGTTSCATGSQTCVLAGNAPSTTPCGGGGDAGGFCNGSGSCSICSGGVSCSTGNPCQIGQTMCPGGLCGSVGNQPPGTPCSGGTCDGSGMCRSCTPGSPCTINECTYGRIDCGMGFPMCTTSGYVASGTTCSGGVCDGSGNCGPPPCMMGSCGPAQNCLQFIYDCDAGSTCTRVNDPPGTSCRFSAGICDGAGNCVIMPG